MRHLKIYLFALFLAYAVAMVLLMSLTVRASGCDQIVYDKVYKGIIEDALITPVTREYLEERNNTISVLRSLCNGQISTYEINSPINKPVSKPTRRKHDN